MIYQPSKEFLFTGMLWAGFLPAFQAVNVYSFWNPAGLSRNALLICSLLVFLFVSGCVALVVVKIYRNKLYFNEEAMGVLHGINEMEIKWNEVTQIEIQQRSWLFFSFTVLAVRSKTAKLVYRFSFLPASDRKEIEATIASKRDYPAFD